MCTHRGSAPRHRLLCSSSQTPDYYQLLGVSRQASAADIKKAYFAAAKASHPDLNPGSANAARQFRLVAEAYETLRDPAKRSAYDLGGAGAGQQQQR